MRRSLVNRNAFRVGITSDACIELVGDMVGRRRANTQSKALDSIRGEKNRYECPGFTDHTRSYKTRHFVVYG